MVGFVLLMKIAQDGSTGLTLGKSFMIFWKFPPVLNVQGAGPDPFREKYGWRESNEVLDKKKGVNKDGE